ncbi:MAG TPA: DUF2339 domain-containing protein [Caldimonas sp.]
MTSLIAAVLGGIAGAFIDAGRGVWIGAFFGWLIWRSVQQQRRIEGLEKALDKVHATLPGSATTAPAVAPRASEAPVRGPDPVPVHADGVDRAEAPAPLSPPGPAGLPAAPDDFWDTEPGIGPTAPRAAPPQPPSVDVFGAVRGWFFGGNTIVKAGVGILFVGLAFLAKFASEHVHVPVEMRLASIAGVALALLLIGWRLRLRRPAYAQVLQGGAVAVLYLTLFVAFRFYGVLAAAPVFALMAVVAALAAALAVLQDARALAVVGALGGFATPLLVSTGSGNHVALFSYYLVLDLGIAAVAWHKTWRALNLVGFFGTFIVATAWGVLKYSADNFASTEAFLIAFFLLFIAIMVLPARRAVAAGDAPRDPHRSAAWVNSSLLFGLPTIVFALQYGLVRHTDYGVALSALVLAGFYVALASWMRSRPQLGLTFDASLAIGIVFLTLVIPFALDARSTAGAWALEGAGLVWIGLRQSRALARAFGYALLVLAGFSMFYAHERHGVPRAVFNAYLFNAWMAAGASLAAAYFVRRHADRTSAEHDEAVAEPLLIGWATLWLLAAAGLEIDSFVDAPFTLAAWLACASAIALLYLALSVRLQWRNVAWPLVAHAPLLAFATFASAVVLASPAQHGGWWAWPLALGVHVAVLWFAAPRWPKPARHAVHALGALVLGALGALQGRAITADWGDAASAWAWLGWLVVPAVLLIVLPRPAAARRWPVRALPEAYQATASAVLAAGLLVWTLIANFASDGSAQPLPHAPLLNPLDLGIGIALAAVALWMRSAGAQARLAAWRGLAVSLLAVAGFVWLNAMLVRGFHHYAGVPYQVEAWMASLAVQTGIALLWTVTALVLMWFSASRSERVAWMVGAGLLGAVVLKLLLVDLSASGTVTRIVSFIGVGVLMLVIGYVAPLPAKEERHAAV